MRTNKKNKKIDLNKLAKEFIVNPEKFTLYRGEGAINQGGLHFTPDKNWVKHFGTAVLQGRLPPGAKIKIITAEDLKMAYHRGIMTDKMFYESIFADGYDAIIGHDAMDFNVLDVIVNPKLLDRFKQKVNDYS